MKMFLIGLGLLACMSSFGMEGEIFIDNPLKAIKINSSLITKDEKNSLEKVVSGIEYKNIDIPNEEKNFYLICEDARVQYVLGLGVGNCTALSVSSKGIISLIPAKLYAGYIGAAIEATFSMGKHVKINNVNSLRDYSSVYFSTDSGAAFIVAGSVKHSTNSLKGKSSLGDLDFRGGFGANLISANLSYIYIDKDQRIISFKLDKESIEHLKLD